jgi:hypothetical protein
MDGGNWLGPLQTTFTALAAADETGIVIAPIGFAERAQTLYDLVSRRQDRFESQRPTHGSGRRWYAAAEIRRPGVGGAPASLIHFRERNGCPRTEPIAAEFVMQWQASPPVESRAVGNT